MALAEAKKAAEEVASKDKAYEDSGFFKATYDVFKILEYYALEDPGPDGGQLGRGKGDAGTMGREAPCGAKVAFWCNLGVMWDT